MGLEDLQKPAETTTEETHTQPVTPEPTEEKVYTRKAYATLQTQLNKANDRIKELEGQFDTMNTAKSHAETLADQRFQALTTANATIKDLNDKLGPLTGMSTKFDAFQELIGADTWKLAPDATLQLMGLLNDIPAGQDLETTKGTILKLANFGQSAASQAAKQTEKEVTEGQTPGYQGGTPGGQNPTTQEGWAKAVDGKDTNDPIWGKYFAWVQEQQSG